MELKELVKKSQDELKKDLVKYLKENGYENKILSNTKYVFAEGELPIMLVAHMDTVHKTKCTDVYYDSEQTVMWSPQGIGGDDRCGIYAILQLLSYKPYILFTTDEEIGCIGASKFTEEYMFDLASRVKFIIEIDRRGNNQAVFYKCDNKEFKDYILGFGFKEEQGSCSDISKLSPAYDIASVNLSAGYYSEHTLQETINLTHLQNTIEKIEKIFEDNVNQPKYFDFQEKKYTYNYGNYYNYSNYKSTPSNTTKTEETKKEKVEEILEDDYDDEFKIYDDWEYADENVSEEDELFNNEYTMFLEFLEEAKTLSDEEFVEVWGCKKPPQDPTKRWTYFDENVLAFLGEGVEDEEDKQQTEGKKTEKDT